MSGVFDAEKNEWTPNGADWKYTNLHPATLKCLSDGCMIHNPDESWVGNREDWPYFPRVDGRMERLCPHGVGHADPNAVKFLVSRGWTELAAATHGCDGCCSGNGRF